MNYSELHYILCIAKHQNLTRAAQELYISQPTLTKHLQKLEREMGRNSSAEMEILMCRPIPEENTWNTPVKFFR